MINEARADQPIQTGTSYPLPHLRAGHFDCLFRPRSREIVGARPRISRILVAILLGAATLLPNAMAVGDVSGTVRDDATMLPIAGALVTLQTTDTQTATAADGSYSLPIASGTNLVIVAAHKGYFNGSVMIDAPATGADILLDAVPQDDDPAYGLQSPDFCGGCHPNQYDEWNGTAMANAGLNTWVHDTYDGTGTPGGMGGFVYTRDSVFADTNPNSECASCHQPELWIDDPFSRMENPLDFGYPTEGVLHGISCEVCHKVADVDVSKINFPGIFPGAVAFTRPAGPSVRQVQYGVLGDTDYSSPFLMRSSYQPQLVAELCGTCHQDKNDPAQDHSYTGVISEPTYLEWAASPYGVPESPSYATCVDCHLPPSGETEVCLILFPPLIRDPETIRSHRIEGTTAQYLENAVELSVQAAQIGDGITVDVDVTNAHTGHHVPTGVTVRNMILLVEASRNGDGLALEHTGKQIVHDLGGIGDPAEGYYAGLPGRLYAKVIHDADFQAPTFFTDATGIVFDNRIPALATDSSSYTFALPPGGGTVDIRARVIYRRAFRSFVDAKQWTEDGHGNPLEDVQPPHFGHLMEAATATVVLADGDFDLDGDVDLDDHFAFTDCVSGPGEPPDPSPPTTPQDCLDAFDFNGNGGVDLPDFAHFALAFTG